VYNLKEIKFKIGPEFADGSSTEATATITPHNNENQADTHIDVGLSDCDNLRADRTNEAKCLWNKVEAKEFINGLFRPSLLFIREALSCYQNGAFLGATILCRSAIDSLLVAAVYSDFNAETCTIQIELPKKDVSFKSLRCCAQKKIF
jgi:hypothetical protein